MFADKTAYNLRKLLENFETIGALPDMAIVSSESSSETFRDNIKTAIVASSLNLHSLDYVKKSYVNDMPTKDDKLTEFDLYRQAYNTSKDYILDAQKRVLKNKQRENHYGEFGAFVVLKRLESSFFSAHLLYSLGNVYEGHAISRLILEQIAWAFEASNSNDIDKIKAIKATKAITRLKSFYPDAGRLYRFLNDFTHINYDRHGEFLTIEDGEGCVLHTQSRYLEYAKCLLKLADAYVAVFEYSQHEYLKYFKATNNHDRSLSNKRSFVIKAQAIVDSFHEVQNNCCESVG